MDAALLEFARPARRGKRNPLTRYRLFNIELIAWLSLVSMGLVIPAKGDPLDHWVRTQMPTNIDFYTGSHGMLLGNVTFGNGRYVAAGEYLGSDAGFVETSDDGMTWNLHSNGYDVLDLYDVTWANGAFVAVGWDYWNGANIYDSTNGIDWTAHTSMSGNVRRVIFGGGQFVAVGDGDLYYSGTTNRNIYTSPDGTTWTARNSGSPASDVRAISDVAYGNGRYVAMGAGYLFRSTTGSSWTRVASSVGSPITFGNGVFLASAGANQMISTNGSSWSQVAKDVTNVFSRIIYQSPYYLALSGPALFTSTNGTNWVQRNLQAPTNTVLTGVAVGNGNVVAVGYTNVSGPGTLFAPVAYVSGPLVELGVSSGLPGQLNLSGWPGRTYRIECVTDALARSNNWQPLATFTLTNSPLLWTDSTATNSQRYYRAVLLP
jgi:hypothetical protein